METFVAINKEFVPINNKYMLSIDEAAIYFHIGKNRLRKIVARNLNKNWTFYNGQQVLIKRELFEQTLDKMDTI